MQFFTNKITLKKNKRGVWDLDPFKGCEDGIKNNKDGCYGLCYAKRIADSKGFDFGKSVYRNFISEKHLNSVGKVISQTSFLNGVQPPFIRMGVMCDPSFEWEHTLKIVEQVKRFNPKIVIITKHWKELKQEQLKHLTGQIFVNTSISALDHKQEIEKRLFWYNKLKNYCHSILRVNTADFIPKELIKIQNDLLCNANTINNILRIPKSHYLTINNIVKVKKHKFINKEVYASIQNKKTFFGKCIFCKEKCGVSFFTSN